MAFEVAAAIVGILAAAGKVAETLGPIISTFVHAPKHAQTLLTEVKHARTILLGLQTLFEDLGASPPHRKQMIQIDQLITSLTDGVLLFSELEALVDQLGILNFTLPDRMRWAKKNCKLESLVSRLVSFKTSMDLMLNILRFGSDQDAQRDRQELLSITSALLENNLRLSKRIARLEDCFVAGNSVANHQLSSLAPTAASVQEFRIGRLADVKVRSTMVAPEEARAFQFDSDLEASRVYRKARRHTTDFSYRSSIVLSHAWTTLSDVSLSDISAISVVALPLYQTDITNNHHYVFGSSNIHSKEVDQSVQPAWPLGDNFVPELSSPQLPKRMPTSDETALPSGSPPFPKINVRPSTELKLVVKGMPEAGIYSLIARFINPLYELHELGNAAKFANMSDKTCMIDGLSVHLNIRVVNILTESTYTGPTHYHFQNGDIFVLVYSTTSRVSFDFIRQDISSVCQWKDKDTPPIMILGNHSDRITNREVSKQEGESLALETGYVFCEVNEEDFSSFDEAVFNLVRARWAFERQQKKDRFLRECGEKEMRAARESRTAQLLRDSRRSRTILRRLRLDSLMDVIEED